MSTIDRAALTSEHYRPYFEYWQERYSLIGEPFHFQGDRKSLSGDREKVSFVPGEGLSALVTGLVKGNDTGVFVVMLSGLQILTSKYRGYGSMTLHAPLYNAESAQMSTHCIIAGRTESTFTIREVLVSMQAAVTKACKYQDFPLSELEGADPAVFSSNIWVGFPRIHPAPAPAARYDLEITLSRENDSLSLEFDYNSKVFSGDFIQNLFRHYVRILDAFRNPSTMLKDIEMISAEEKEQLLYGFNATATAYPSDKTIAQLFEEQAALTPDALAVCSGEERLTYSRLNEKANQLAHHLRVNYAVTAGDIIGLVSDRSVLTIVSVLGILKAGGAYMPLDAEYPAERIRYMLSDAKPKALLVSSSDMEKLEGTDVLVFVTDLQLEFLDDSLENPAPLSTSRDLAYVIYTSGSTGNPKGVLIEQQSVVRLVKNTNYISISPSDRIFQTGSLAFDASTFEIWGALLHGASLFLATQHQLLDTRKLSLYFADNGITVIWLTSSLFNQLCDSDITLFRGLRCLLAGGDKLSAAHINRVRQEYPLLQVINGYGPTENTTFTACHPIESFYEQDIPLGRPISNTQVYVLSSAGELVPVGVAGEICAGGDGLARGYLNNGELTALKFTDNPVMPGSRIYRTGDIGSWNSKGELEFAGRRDSQVKIRGFRIETGEIESHLARLSGVREALVVVREISGSKELVAYYTAENASLTAEEVRSGLGKTLPAYMIPAYLVKLEKFPLTVNGKVNRALLPDPLQEVVADRYSPPVTDTQKTLVELWQEVLGHNRIGIKDNFFDLGGHSLKATALISRIHKVLNAELPILELFTSPTIEETAAWLDRQEAKAFIHLPKAAWSEFYPVSSAQKRLYILSQFEGAETAYNIPYVLSLKGELDRERLVNALNTLAERHESLRTSFVMKDGEPVQKIEARISFVVEEYQCAEGEADEIIRAFVRPFDLSQAPLLRAALVRIDERYHLLAFDMHHIITDGVSSGIFIRELSELYQGKSLEQPALQYKDYSTWQKEFVSSADYSSQEQFWMEQLSGELPALDLPYDFERPPVQRFEGDRLHFLLSIEELAAVRELARAYGTTPFVVLLAAYKVLLHRYTGQEDIVVGTPVAARRHADLENVVGMFVNTLALRSHPAASATFGSFLAELKTNVARAFENQSYAFEDLVEKLHLQRDMSRNPLFDTVFVFQNMELGSFDLPGLSISPYTYRNRTAKFDLTLDASETDKGLAYSIEYSTRLFRRETIERMGRHFRNILLAAASAGDMPLSMIPLTDSAEEELLHSFNSSVDAGFSDTTITALFEEQVRKHPERTALSLDGTTLSYRELGEKVSRLAHSLRGRGVDRDCIVAMLTERSVEMIIGMLAILKAGGAYLPLDPDYPADRIRFMLEDSGTKLLLSTLPQEKLSEYGFPVQTLHLTSLSCTLAEADSQNLQFTNSPIHHSTNPPLHHSTNSPLHHSTSSPLHQFTNSPNDLAYIIYTSGSTGTPKGVMIEHRNVVRLLFHDQNLFDFSEKDSWSLFHSYCFDFSVWEMYGALLHGGKLVIIPRETARDPKAFLDVLEKEEVTVLNQTPGSFYNLIHEEQRSSRSLNLRYVIFGGEALKPLMLKDWRKKYPGTKLVNMYGITETTVHVTYKEIGEQEIEAGISNIGVPIPTLSTYILDAQQQLQPVGVSGEICVGGHGLARGYLNRAELTQERFIAHPFRKGERLYRSGDLGRYLPNGEIEYLGRMDHQVKIRGHRIELGEIESALLKQEGVREAVVVDRHDESGSAYLAAYVVAAEGNPDITMLREQLTSQLPDYMIPSYFVALERLPLTVNGKVDRKKLPDPVESFVSNAEYIAPEGEVQMKLAELWQEILGISRVSAGDNFFESGGHSLKATLLVSAIHKAFHVDIPLRDIFRYPVFRDIAQCIKNAARKEFHSIQPAEPKAHYALSSAQKRLFIVSLLEGAGTGYNIPEVQEVKGPLDLEKVEYVFQSLIRRHENLRTSFSLLDGEPVQTVQGQTDFTLSVIPADKDGLQASIDAFIQPFDLSKAPLIRLGVVQTDESTAYLLFDIHHIIADGVSVNLLVKEFVQLYNGAELPPVKLQYKDFAEWQKGYLSGALLKKQEDFWTSEFRDGVPVLNLPSDFTRPSVMDFRGDRIQFELNAAQAAAVKELAVRTGTTPFMVMLSAYSILLSRYSGQEDVVIGSPVAGRRHDDLHGIIGMFVNTLALRSKPSAGKTFYVFLQELKEKCLKAFENQDYPFEELVEKLEIRRDMSRNPLFDTMFAYQNMKEEKMEVKGLEMKPFAFSNRTAKFDLTLDVRESHTGLKCTLEYATSLFREETARMMAGHLVNLLEHVTREPSVRIQDIAMMSETERHKLLTEINDMEVSYPPATVTGLFRRQAALTPQAVAVTAGSDTITYGELDRKSDQVAAWLLRKGATAESIVAVMVQPSLEMIIGVLGILKAGAAYLPVDPFYPESRISFMLKDSAVKILLIDENIHRKIDYKGYILNLRDSQVYSEPLSEIPLTEASPDDLAYVIYTSGSTGTPKGVMIEHASFFDYICTFRTLFGLGGSDSALLVSSISFDASVEEIFPTLVTGGKLVVVKNQKNLQEVLDTIEEQKVTWLTGTAGLISFLDENTDRLGSMRFLLNGGDVLKASYIRNLMQKMEVYNLYGPTESTIASTWCRVDGSGTELIPIGKPLPNRKIYILDSNLNPQPVGVPGELCIGGAGLARGYLNRDTLTSEKFIPNPFATGERIYRTGDLARWRPDGHIDFIGRADHQVKIRGYRIELGEIESALQQHPSVKEVLVADKEDSTGTKYLCAYVIAHSKVNTQEIRNFLARYIPEYMIPARFVSLERFPLLPNGKIDRKALPEPAMADTADAAFVAPSTPTEKAIESMWKEVLGLARVSVHQNFFETGGNSLKIIRLYKLVDEAFPDVTRVSDLFDQPTIFRISAFIDSRAGKKGDKETRSVRKLQL
jgi:amino acid adenylation domain-containing protein